MHSFRLIHGSTNPTLEHFVLLSEKLAKYIRPGTILLFLWKIDAWEIHCVPVAHDKNLQLWEDRCILQHL